MSDENQPIYDDANTIRPGEHVVDIESDEENPAVVVEFSLSPADEYEINDLEKTVAEVNPKYPPSDNVVTVAFIEALDDAFPSWREADRAVLDQWAAKFGVKTYSYPQTRLRKVIPDE
jgi:hypothetical protein